MCERVTVPQAEKKLDKYLTPLQIPWNKTDTLKHF